MCTNYKLSRFLGTIEYDELVAIFHLLHPEPVYFTRDTWERVLDNVQALPEPVETELIRQKVLVTSDDTDDQELKSYRISITKLLDRPSILYLMLAQWCNNECTYCPIPALALKHGNNLLSFEDAVAGIKLWQEHLMDGYANKDEPRCIIFYGGEPLLNRIVFEQLVEYIAVQQKTGGLPSSLELILPTNGLLIDPQLAEVLAKHNILTVLGIDGSPLYNNVTRRTSRGEATSSAIEDSVRLLHTYGVRLAASTTLTPANVHAADEHKEYLAQLGIKHMGFNLLKGAALQISLGATMSAEDYYRMAAKAIVAGYEREEISVVQEYQLQKKLDALTANKPFAVDCTCYGNQIVIQADGVVTNCPFLRINLGHVRSLPNGFRIRQTHTVQSWRRRIPLLYGEDNDSWRNSFLHGGGCAWGAHELFGTVTTQDMGNQIFNEEVMHGLIWKRLPRQARERLCRGEIDYWSNRWIWSV